MLGGAATNAAPIEGLPVVSAAAILGAEATGANYQIDNAVRSDGFLYLFSLNTPYGRFQVEGRDMLKKRLRELAAIVTLEQMNKSQVYANAAAKAAMKPVDLATGLVTNPAGTIEKSISGVGAMFSRFSSAASNIGKSRENAADSLLGVSSAKRQIAVKLGVDPYTDFKPLAERLDGIARVTALGNLTISGAFMAIPGGAGMAVSYSKTTQEIGRMVADKTASELRESNRAKLAHMGVSKPVMNAFLDNTYYTPLDQTVLVAALGRMIGVKDRHLFVVRASQAPNGDLAFFMRRRAETLSDHHTRVEPLSDFIEVRGFPLNRTRSGKVLVLVPLDQFVWTKQGSDLAAAVNQDVKQRKLGTAIEFRVGGTVTATAKQGLSERGWKVFEHVSQ